jgi:hypothetical protein
MKTLTQHKKLAKFCLAKQNKKFVCEHCNDISYSTKDFEFHENNCVEILKIKNKDLEEQIKDIIYYQNENENLKQKIIDIEKDKKYLQEQISHLQNEIIAVNKTAVSKPTNITTTNNINNKIMNMNVLDFNTDNVKNIINDKYCLDIISEGQKGVARFATDFLLRDENGNLKYVCTDPSRKIFKYKNNLGEIEKDVNATKLTSLIADSGVLEATKKISSDHWTSEDGSIDNDKFSKLYCKSIEINSLKDDNTIFKNELVSQTSI